MSDADHTLQIAMTFTRALVTVAGYLTPAARRAAIGDLLALEAANAAELHLISQIVDVVEATGGEP